MARRAGFPIPLQERLSYRCLMIASRVSRFLAPMWESRYGLSVVNWRVLAVIARYGPLSATDAALHSSTEVFHISRAADQLVARKLVRRTVDAGDRRRVRLELTKLGRSAHREIEMVMSRVEGELLSGLSRQEHEAIRQALTTLEERTLTLLGSSLTWKDFA